MTYGLCFLFIISIAVLLPIAAHTALLPPSFINSVVALGGIQTIGEVGQPPQTRWNTEGTGFFYGYLVKDDPDPTKRHYEVYLVTARHVVQGHLQNQKHLPSEQQSDLKVRVNPKTSASPGGEFPIPSQPKKGEGTWFYHSDQTIDLASVLVNFTTLREKGFEPNFFANDNNVANADKLRILEVAAGDGIFVLGFPMNLAGTQRNYVIVRQGCIARISEMLDTASTTFLLDAFMFPGNSGGPVVLKPEIVSIAGTKSQQSAYLIGVVISYRSYTDIAVSSQTKRPRIIFEENSGLAEVLPTNYIDEMIKAWKKSNQTTTQQAP